MPEEEIHGAEVDVTGNRQWPKNYEPSDVARVYHDAQPKSWDDVLNFLEHGATDKWHLTPGEVVDMKEDFARVKKQGIPFTDNPEKSYKDAQQFRQEDLKKYGQPQPKNPPSS